MSDQNLFAEDWANCLRAHYAHVIHEHDDNNEKSLITVLLQTGFTEDDIQEMRAEAIGEMEPPEEIAEPPMTALAQEEYEWVIPQEPQVATAEAEAYQWVVETPPEETPTAEVEAVEIVESLEATVEAVPLDSATLEPEPPVAEVEVPVDSTEPDVPATDPKEDEPPESFVQMSLF